MSSTATKEDMEQLGAKMGSLETRLEAKMGSLETRLEAKIDKAFEDLSDIITNFAQQVDDRFAKVETRLDSLEQKYDHLINTLDSFVGRIDKYETERAARDSQFEKLLEWARKVSVKTGIPLENL